MKQQLNHLMILHIHKKLTDALEVKEIANDFFSQNERRIQIFGKFT